MVKLMKVDTGNGPVLLSPDGGHGFFAEKLGSSDDVPSVLEPLLQSKRVEFDVRRGAQFFPQHASWHPTRPLIAARAAQDAGRGLVIIDAAEGTVRSLPEAPLANDKQPWDHVIGWLDDSVLVGRGRSLVEIRLDGRVTTLLDTYSPSKGVSTIDGVHMTSLPHSELVTVGQDRSIDRTPIPDVPKRLAGPYKRMLFTTLAAHGDRLLVYVDWLGSRSKKPEPSRPWWFDRTSGELTPLFTPSDGTHQLGGNIAILENQSSVIFTARIGSEKHLMHAQLDAAWPIDVSEATSLLTSEQLLGGFSNGEIPSNANGLFGVYIHPEWNLFQLETA